MALGGAGWRISARIAFQSNGAALMTGLARQSNMLNASLARQQGQITKSQLAMTRYQSRLAAVSEAQQKFGTKIALTGAAIGVGVLAEATNEAAKFQRAMTGVQIATNASGKSFQTLQRLAVTISGQTAQSATTIAEEMQVAATVALKNPAQLAKLFPMMAKYADVRYMASGGQEGAVESVGKMSQFAHFFSAWNPAQLARMLNDTAKLQFATHVSLDQLVTQGRQFIPSATKYGVSEHDIMRTLAVAGQTGFLQGRGGTAVNSIISYAMGATSITDHMSKARRSAMVDMKMFDASGHLKFIDPQGHLLLSKMVDHLLYMRNRMIASDPRYGKGRFGNDAANAFGKPGSQFVNLLADPATKALMKRNDAYMKTAPGVQGQWKAYAGDFFYQWNAFTTNLRNVGMALALPALPRATAGLIKLNGAITKLIDHEMQHPNEAKAVFGGAAFLTASLALRGFVGLARQASSLSTALKVISAGGAVAAASSGTVAAGAAAGAGAAGFLGRAALVSARVWALLDNFVLAGFGKVAVTIGTKLVAGLNVRILLPVLGLVNKIPMLGPKMAQAALKVVGLVAGIGSLEGAFGGLLAVVMRFLGPLGAAISVLGVFAPNMARNAEQMPLMGKSADTWLKMYRRGAGNAIPSSVSDELGIYRGGDRFSADRYRRSGAYGGAGKIEQHFNFNVATTHPIDHEGGVAFAKAFQQHVRSQTGVRGGAASTSPLLPQFGATGTHGF